jgi:hypothetical protein
MYTVGDSVIPLIGKFKDEPAEVTEVEDRENGSITVKFADGVECLYFKNELRPGKSKQ